MTKVQILGTGCPKCQSLAANAEEAIRGLNGEFEIEKITEIPEILKFGVMMTPALAVDGEVKAAGRLLSSDEIRHLLT